MNDLQELTPGNVKEVMRAHKTGVADVYMVRLDALRVRAGFNAAREADPDYPAAVREYADSMKANGFFRHKPIKVTAASDGFLYISDGHTRFDAVQLANREGAGIESIPVINEMRGTTEEDRIFGLILDNSGRKLTPLGEAMVIKQLLGRGIEEKEIARRLGYSITKVANALTLVAAPAAIRNMVAQGEVSATTAVKTMKSEGANATATLEKAKASAKAQGKTKVTGKHLKTAPKTLSDTQLIDWIESRRDVALRQWYREGQISYFAVTDSDDTKIAEGPTLREAIRAAIEATKDES
ncbi:TPA: ParB/RepB/Spo0J family partition protein [Burkholderia contaminans]|uniref:ParB/RepB/Spo0J family partition protein n=1 Tax=Burkholderia contaminans TaxID=488447 RepID=UPI000CFE7BAC|nr:ParB N-terminal domain-containing protein [Burkholderia contaminans]HDR9065522.1 ParB N-terminal domain-containing protein [Burkholderia vietnamiensis]MBM6427961.1 ParB N-terminal domain-containing protein [Burkholderia contaminans]MCA7876791.1 ParB/Srx family N-terminal domain-containing protein [Burkholderia contaminans]MDN8024185.1 ParB N-terminal domain-containing protein [Burkholderia contaminans]PRG12187.1 chromosome partitioning protein ParB [Burkholderia contaminans]